jgi:hypothetical protein
MSQSGTEKTPLCFCVSNYRFITAKFLMEILFMKPDNDSGKQRSTDSFLLGFPLREMIFTVHRTRIRNSPFCTWKSEGRRNLTVSALPVISEQIDLS